MGGLLTVARLPDVGGLDSGGREPDRLAGNRKALGDLKRRYGAALAVDSRVESLALLTSDARRPEIARIAAELAGVERIRAFVASDGASLEAGGTGSANSRGARRVG